MTETLFPPSLTSLEDSLLLGLADSLEPIIDEAYTLPGAEQHWRDWLEENFSHVCTAGFAKRHIDLWEWEESLQPGVRPKAKIDIWPRGGGKSTTVELIGARVCTTLKRRFMMIVSETQDQANQRISAIGTHFEKLGVKRAVNQFGNSKGWRVDILRTSNGFNVLAYGLDAAARGVKLDHFRPDFIVLDDIDALHDTPQATEKKIDTLTKTVLPTGSADCAILYVQNRILEFGIMSQLADGSAEFLLNRIPISEEPAIIGAEYEPYEDETGLRKYRIKDGVFTWAGQGKETCEAFIHDFGLKAFRTESQHEVQGSGGVFFKPDMLRNVLPADVPKFRKVCLAVDWAATEGAGDYTAIGLLGTDSAGKCYVRAVIRGQWSPENVNKVLKLACETYLPQYPANDRILRLPIDPAAAGKRAAKMDEEQFKDWKPVLKVVSGSKATRATDLAESINLGNTYLVEEDLPPCFAPFVESLSWKHWHHFYKDELRKFREDEKHPFDDQVDMSSDAYEEVKMPKRTIQVLNMR